MDELRRFALQLGRVSLEQSVETLPRFRPVFPQERDLSQVETRIPKFRIGRESLLQRHLGLIVFGLPHQDDTAQILRLSQIRLARIDRIEFLQRLRVVVGIEFAESLVVHRLELRFGGGDIGRRKGTEN